MHVLEEENYFCFIGTSFALTDNIRVNTGKVSDVRYLQVLNRDLANDISIKLHTTGNDKIVIKKNEYLPISEIHVKNIFITNETIHDVPIMVLGTGI